MAMTGEAGHGQPRPPVPQRAAGGCGANARLRCYAVLSDATKTETAFRACMHVIGTTAVCSCTSTAAAFAAVADHDY